ncbi:MAG: 4Fe-4S dicluster domain-containing protein [Candidatus Omnitrophica bacterium]|nr:4Fe-4S dicluster domain-containing protein [Candidatus Omnitrophota bacterium]
MYITKNNFTKFLDSLKKDYDVFVPVKKDKQRFYKRYDTFSDDIVLGEVRAFEPLKAFYSRAREKVADGFKPDATFAGNKPFAVVGVKACDLKGFKVQDFVFFAKGENHDYEDPFYIKNRHDNLIISSDCTCAIDTCFCIALGIRPYPKEDFDINISEISGGFLAQAGSDKGKDIINKNSDLFQDEPHGASDKRDAIRAYTAKQVEKNIKENEIPNQDLFGDIISKNYDSDIWKDEAKACVECGCCNTVCPTCHCFLLYDQKNEDNMARMRIWDSCLIKDFARVAGGANPRHKLWMRLRNRFDKKFDFFPKVANIYACTGCGRCISGCPAKIDIRKVLKRLVKNA